jgi:hypothetical protein
MNYNQKIPFKFLMVVSIALFMAIAVPTNAVLADTSSPYLNIKTAVVNGAVNGAALQAVLYTGGHIPKDGSGGAFGYGILTSAGDNAVIVATTHEGVKDSIAQGSDSGPIWHTHFVRLVSDTATCGSGARVAAITFEQPGRVVVTGNTAIFDLIPSSFTGTAAEPLIDSQGQPTTGKPLTLTPGHNVQNVVSFELQPIIQGGVLQAVCVQNITPAQQIVTNPNTIGN